MACTGHVNLTSCSGHTITPCIGHNAAVCSGHVATACHSHVTTACHSHVNSCPSHSGYIAPVDATVFTDPTLTTSTNIKAVHHNELRLAIYYEIVRRSKTWTDPGVATEGTTNVSSTYIRNLRNLITLCKTWTIPSYLLDDATGTDDANLVTQYTTLRSQINDYKAECLCNCNYACTCLCNYACTCLCNYACTCQCNYVCTCNCNYACTCQCNYACTCNCNYCPCNCNYCPCNCNYCPCNCNYCPCNCNYACVCDCNYSDKRLKTDIIYM